MRAICDACGRPQPVDWKSGDLCIHCGHSVRRDVRCFWCVKRTPASGKYCRTCGAVVVEDRLFGAARMLKNAGVDRFGIPKMLVELDPDQIENFTNIYQRHAAVMNRHVDHVRFLESFLQHKTWSDALEEELIPQLPWTEERLNELSPAMPPFELGVTGSLSREESVEAAKAISSITPFRTTDSLSLLARLHLGDMEIMREATGVLNTFDPLLAGEAALALTHWRVYYTPGLYFERDVHRRLLDALRACPMKIPAAVQFVMVGGEGMDLPAEVLMSDNADIAFSAALASGHVDTLAAAERDADPMKRYVAAWRLVRMGLFTGVGDVLRTVQPVYQRDLLQQINMKKKSAPGLHDAFLELVERSEDHGVREAASSALLNCLQPGDTMRIAKAAKGSARVYQSLLQTASIDPEDLVALCDFLLETGAFQADRWGMPDVAKEGRLPASFVPRHWSKADERGKVELCKFAEMQLEQYSDEELHRWMVNLIFGAEDHKVQQQAWTCLFRWYGRSDHTGMGPLRIQAESLTRFFGSTAAFIPVLTRFLGDGSPRPILEELFVREPLAKLLRYAEADVLPHLAGSTRPVLALVDALKGVLRRQEYDLMLRLAAIDLLVLLAGVPKARAGVVAVLRSFAGTDLDYGSSKGLERVEIESKVEP